MRRLALGALLVTLAACAPRQGISPPPKPAGPLPSEAAHYDSVALRRLDARPGMTCIWQTRARDKRNVSFDEWIEMDVEYIRRWSLWLDVRLLLRTTGAVIRMTGS